MHFFLVYISISRVKIHAANKANKVHAFKDINTTVEQYLPEFPPS